MATDVALTIAEARALLLASPGWEGEIVFRLDRPWTDEERLALLCDGSVQEDGDGA